MTAGQFAEIVKGMRKAQKAAANATAYTIAGRALIRDKELLEDQVDDILAERDRAKYEKIERNQQTLWT